MTIHNAWKAFGDETATLPVIFLKSFHLLDVGEPHMLLINRNFLLSSDSFCTVLLWTLLMCLFKDPFVEKPFKQPMIMHSNGRSLRWTMFTCVRRLYPDEKAFPQPGCSHLKFFL